MAVNSYQLDSVLDPWTHKHIWTPTGVTFVTNINPEDYSTWQTSLYTSKSTQSMVVVSYKLESEGYMQIQNRGDISKGQKGIVHKTREMVCKTRRMVEKVI